MDLEKLKIVFIGNNTLIGCYEGSLMKNPRGIVTVPDQRNRPVLGMQTLIGNPSQIEIVTPQVVYEVNDKMLIDLYIKATTKIIPPSEGLPPGVFQLPGGKS